jgi:hypothetical protein
VTLQLLASPTPAPVRADGLVDMLRRHYLPDGRPPGGIFAGEIESPDGRRRADALWAPWSIAGGMGIVGHEVKVSRSDVLVELADPMKAEPWARYCSHWWLVVAHPSLVDGLAVPEAWGIMSPPSGRRTRTMTVLRPAPKLTPIDTGPAWRRIASWEHNRLTARLFKAEQDAEYRKHHVERLQHELTERQLAGEARPSPHAVRVGRILTALEQRRLEMDGVDDDAVIQALVDLGISNNAARRARQEVEWIASEVRRLIDRSEFDRIARELEKLARPSPLAVVD